MSATDARTQKLDLRLSQAAKETLRAAAEASRRSVSEFVLESALARAQETLADRQRFGLPAEQWTAFMQALDGPVRPIPRAEALLREPSVFESE